MSQFATLAILGAACAQASWLNLASEPALLGDELRHTRMEAPVDHEEMHFGHGKYLDANHLFPEEQSLIDSYAAAMKEKGSHDKFHHPEPSPQNQVPPTPVSSESSASSSSEHSSEVLTSSSSSESSEDEQAAQNDMFDVFEDEDTIKE